MERYVLAWDAGVLDGERVELLDGESVRTVPIGPWHAATTPRLVRGLPGDGVALYQGTLPSGPRSVPDPDLFAVRAGALPTSELGARLRGWDPADVLLVVEVSDTTLRYDLTTKADIYAAAGLPTFWVVSRDVVVVITCPGPRGCPERTEGARGDALPVPYSVMQLDVAALLG